VLFDADPTERLAQRGLTGNMSPGITCIQQVSYRDSIFCGMLLPPGQGYVIRLHVSAFTGLVGPVPSGVQVSQSPGTRSGLS
jgi:hypothetical protein